MYPGVTTRLTSGSVASATSIVGDKDVLLVTGSTAIATIVPKSMNKSGQAQIIFLIPVDGTIATTTADNIVAVQTMLQNRATCFIWVPSTSKWYPHALA